MDTPGDHRICRICNRLYSSASSLQRHIRARHTEDLLTCKYCPKQYRRLSYLNTHLAKAHGEFSHPYPRQLNSVPNNRGTDIQGLSSLYTTERASSPILEEQLQSLATRTGRVRDINKGRCPPSTSLEGTIKTPTKKDAKTVDTDKIKKILATPRKPIQVPNSQLGTELNPELFNRVTNKTPVYCPPPKKVKFSIKQGHKKTEEVKFITPRDYNQQNTSQFQTIDYSAIDFEALRKIPETIKAIENQKAVPSCSKEVTENPTPSTSRETKIATNNCVLPANNPYHEAFNHIKTGLDQLDQEILQNHQLGLDLLLSDSEDDEESMKQAAQELEDILFS